MRNAGVNVLAAFGLDDLWLLDVIGLESERFSWELLRRRELRLFLFSSWRLSSPAWLLLSRQPLPAAEARQLRLSPVSARTWRLENRSAPASELRLSFSVFPPPLAGFGWFLLIQPCDLISRLNFAGLGFLVADHADGLARTFAGAGICRSSLAAHRQAAPVPDAAITIDRLEPLQVALHFAAQIALDLDLVARDRVNDFVDLLRRQILRAQIRIDVRLLENPLGRARSRFRKCKSATLRCASPLEFQLLVICGIKFKLASIHLIANLTPGAVYGAGFCRSRAPRSCASRSCTLHKVFLLMVVLS